MAQPLVLPGTYHRRRPETTALHSIVREHLETFLEAGRSESENGYPRFVERELRRYLDCGLLCHGFARVRCDACGKDTLVAFSCKTRVCPSCQGRRMADTAAYLVDQRLPEAPYRHHVLTVPWVLRYRLAVDRPLLGRVLGTSLRTLFAWQRRRGRARGVRDGHTGSVTFVQRFGGALNLHPHFHTLIPDGLFVPRRLDAPADSTHAPLTFVTLPPPTPEEVEALTECIARRVTALVVRIVEDEETTGGRLDESAASLQAALRQALELPSPADQLTWSDPASDHLSARPRLCAKIAGFSLHAGQAVAADDREALERLCRYGLRPPFAEDRLHLQESGEILYDLARPWPDPAGVTALVMTPMELLARLAALIPSPGTHLIRYHGVFANRSRWRAHLPAPPLPREGTTNETSSPAKDAATDAPIDLRAGNHRRRSPGRSCWRGCF